MVSPEALVTYVFNSWCLQYQDSTLKGKGRWHHHNRSSYFYGRVISDIYALTCHCVHLLCGQGEVHSNVAAILFKIEAVYRLGFTRPSCMSLPCSWNQAFSTKMNNDYCMVQIFDGGKYRQIRRIFINSSTFSPSKFSADNLLPFACQTTFLHRALLIVYAHPCKNFLCPNTYISIAKWIYSYAHIPNKSAKLHHNIYKLCIYGCGIEMSQLPVTSYLFHQLLVLQLH